MKTASVVILKISVMLNKYFEQTYFCKRFARKKKYIYFSQYEFARIFTKWGLFENDFLRNVTRKGFLSSAYYCVYFEIANYMENMISYMSYGKWVIFWQTFFSETTRMRALNLLRFVSRRCTYRKKWPNSQNRFFR